MAGAESIPSEVWALIVGYSAGSWSYVAELNSREPSQTRTALRLLCRSLSSGVNEWILQGMEEIISRYGSLRRLIWISPGIAPPHIRLQKEALLALGRAPTEFLETIDKLECGFLSTLKGLGDFGEGGRKRLRTGMHFIQRPLITLKNLTRIIGPFLTHLDRLPTVELSHLTQLTEIGDNFLRNSGVEEVLLPKSLKVVGHEFLREVTTKRVDLSSTALETVGERFLSYSAVEELLFPPTLKEVGGGFLRSVRMRKVDLSETKLETIGADCLDDATVEEFLLPASVKTFGRSFLKWARTKVVDLSHTAIVAVEDYWFFRGGISELILPRTVNSIGHSFLEQCFAKKVDLARTSVVRVGGSFLHWADIGELLLPSTLEGGDSPFLDGSVKKIDMSRVSSKFSLRGFLGLRSPVEELIIPLCFVGVWQEFFEKDFRGKVRLRVVLPKIDDDEPEKMISEFDVSPTLASRSGWTLRKPA
jgi:hypothetical protein